jgi:hypothetical protein
MKSWKPRDGLHATLLERAASLADTAGGAFPLAASAALTTAPTSTTVPAATAAPTGTTVPTTTAVPTPGAPAGSAAGAAENAPPDAVTEWLTQLTMFYGLPFAYLVPDARLLPTESLRFFYVDRNWQDRMVDGALSIGTSSTADHVMNAGASAAVYAQVDAAQPRMRPRIRLEEPPAGATAGGTWTGLLFRSVAVSTWPGLEVAASAGGNPLQILRMDHLAGDILLCLFNGVPDTVTFTEPGEGLHFGVDAQADSQSFTVSLRGLGFPAGTPYAAGAQVAVPPGSGNFVSATGGFRGGAAQPAGVLDVAGLVSAIQAAMPQGALGPGGALTPGGFAIQMVRGAGLQAYQASHPAPAPPQPTPSPDQG